MFDTSLVFTILRHIIEFFFEYLLHARHSAKGIISFHPHNDMFYYTPFTSKGVEAPKRGPKPPVLYVTGLGNKYWDCLSLDLVTYPWLVWLSGFRVVLRTKGSPV